jgi:peptide/nickel transport system substrate-binding protein
MTTIDRVGRFAIVLMLVIVAACVPATQPQQSQSGSTSSGPQVLTIAWGFDPKILNVAWVYDLGASFISQLLYDPLVKLDIAGNIQPDLAESWDVSPDGKTYTFHLAKNVKWQDGQPLTSADVKWTFDTIIAAKGPGLADLSAIDSITTPDANTVVMQLKQPSGRFLEQVYGGSNQSGGILPKHLFETTPISDLQKNEYNFNPIGSGPFKFVDHVAGDHLTLDANPDYFRGRPPLDRIVFKMVPDVAVALASLESGEAGYMYPRPSFNEISQLQSTPGIKVNLYPGNYTWWLRFNERPEALAESLRGQNAKVVRQALGMALDKNDINQKVFLGLAKPAEGVWPQVSWAFDTNSSQPSYSPERAEQLLDQAGYKRGADGTRFTVHLMIIAGWEGGAAQAIAAIMKEDWKKIGVDTNIDEFDAATSFSKRQAGQFDTFMSSSGYGPDPDQTANWLKSDGFANWYGSHSQLVDQLFEQGAMLQDREQRKPIYFKLQQALVDEATNVSLIYAPTPYTYRDEFTGFFFLPDTISNDMDLSRVRHT